MLRSWSRRLVPVLLVVGLIGCEGTPTVSDPISNLRDPSLSPRFHNGAMQQLDPTPTDKAYLDALKRVIWLPGYTVDVREAALERLKQHDLDGLKVTVRRYLPRLTARLWLNRLCEIIADEGWVDLTPALVSSWARPPGITMDDSARPEFEAMARLHGSERVDDVVFEMFVESNSVAEQGLRTRCWNLLHRRGQRQRLVDLITDGTLDPEDPFLQDLRTGFVEMGIIPQNREEILWLRELCKPAYEGFRRRTRQAISMIGEPRRLGLELRDLPILVSAMLHEPELLQTSDEDLFAALRGDLDELRHYVNASSYDSHVSNIRQRLTEFRDALTWGDLAAMRIAVRAMQVPQVVDHLFDYAERDKKDEGTEYGGVINLDDQGRFEVLEFPPRIRRHDREYNAPQALFDAAYTSLFHFHFHVQDYRNGKYAGPGLGDLNYADNTRANCLVLTFINEQTMNVDYYRHDRVIVDLGVITRD